MDDIDRQIKEIQLQRERIALEKELARHKLTETVIGLPRILSAGIWVALSGFIKGIGRFIKRWWKLAALVILLAAAIYGGNTWIESVEQAKRDEAKAAYEAKFLAFAETKCGDSDRAMQYCKNVESLSAMDQLICMGNRLELTQCYARARVAFAAQKAD